MIGHLVEGRQDRLRSAADSGAAEGPAVVLVGHLRAGLVAVAGEAEIVALQVEVLRAGRIEGGGKQGMGGRPAGGRRLRPLDAGMHLVAMGAVAGGVIEVLAVDGGAAGAEHRAAMGGIAIRTGCRR